MLEDWTGDCRGQFSLAFIEMTAYTLVGGRNDSNVSNPKPKKVIQMLIWFRRALLGYGCEVFFHHVVWVVAKLCLS
jgi:hypothetical protein